MTAADLLPLLLASAEQAAHQSSTDPHSTSGLLTLFTILLAVAVTVGVVTKRLRIPYTAALVLAGLTVAAFQAAPPGAALNPELIFYIVLPPILFRAGLLIDVKVLGKNWLSIAVVTTLGTVVTTLIIGIVIHPFLTPDIIPERLSWLAAFLLGAMLSPTDPIAVMAVLKRVGLPRRLRTVIEGESLFNDGIAVVLFFLLYGALYTGAVSQDDSGLVPVQAKMTEVAPDDEDGLFSSLERPERDHPTGHQEIVGLSDGALKFAGYTVFGLIGGSLLGWIALWMMRWVQDPVLENAITIVLAYGAFLLSSMHHASGVAAVIMAGIIVGVTRWHDRNATISVKTISTFWESVDYILNSLIFLLVGIELQFIGFDSMFSQNVLMAIGIVFAAMLVSRAMVVYPAGALYGRDWPRGGSHIVFWSGLRGCVTLALVLLLPDTLDTEMNQLKSFFLPIVFGTVLLTLLLQSTTMRLLIRRTGCVVSDEVTGA